MIAANAGWACNPSWPEVCQLGDECPGHRTTRGQRQAARVLAWADGMDDPIPPDRVNGYLRSAYVAVHAIGDQR